MAQRKLRLLDSTDHTSVLSDEEAKKHNHYLVTIDETTGRTLEEERFDKGMRFRDKAIFRYEQSNSMEIIIQTCYDHNAQYTGTIKITRDQSTDEEVTEVYDALGNCERRLGGLFSTLEVPLELQTNHNTSHIAVLGDLHGHYTLACTLLNRWEKETGKTLDAVLQVGDMGVFPFPHSILDEATKRFAEHDSDEISFKDFYEGKGDAQLLFGGYKPIIPWNIIFVRGNHEDFDFLAQYADKDSPLSVDHFCCMWYLSNGAVTQIKGRDGRTLTVAGLGGIEQTGHSTEQHNFTNSDFRRLLSMKNIDILLTHQPPVGYVGDGRGSKKVEDLLKSMEPVYHFCGDAHVPGQKLDVPARTQSYILNEVNFQGGRQLKPRGMGILEWQSITENNFTFIEEQWLNEYTRSNYKEKLRELL